MLKVLSLGAGVQSTTLALMAAVGEIEQPDVAIFADTGWEPKRVYEHLEWLITQLPFPVERVTQGNLREDIIASAERCERLSQPPYYLRHPDGHKGQIRRGCTYQYKVRPIERRIRELAGLRPRQRARGILAERWFGISLDEAWRMKDSLLPFVVNRYPLIEREMTRTDCLNWMKAHGYPRPPKSACVGCPYHSDHYWRELRDHDPESWQDAVHMDKVVRHGLRGVRLPAFFHASLVPLDEVDLRTRREKGQLTLWDDFDEECEGMCGV